VEPLPSRPELNGSIVGLAIPSEVISMTEKEQGKQGLHGVGLALAICVGVGVALGLALDSLTIGIAIGTGVGVALSIRPSPAQDADDATRE
jgi:hypothetical protein